MRTVARVVPGWRWLHAALDHLRGGADSGVVDRRREFLLVRAPALLLCPWIGNYIASQET